SGRQIYSLVDLTTLPTLQINRISV
ncbi:uncharacterized protein METZ01_LOCUS98686, partial [marine metagenome]